MLSFLYSRPFMLIIPFSFHFTHPLLSSSCPTFNPRNPESLLRPFMTKDSATSIFLCMLNSPRYFMAKPLATLSTSSFSAFAMNNPVATTALPIMLRVLRLSFSGVSADVW
ncbi:110aa long hypothetical protein [Pyrococcus horikoshii OT3]|uniref:Uncharacterized protein n=1 Tax=Pyrococcus horikoshii (strain ATCC 700860 / DSM 12428 / JCM 9974 / NBRC 100139 / OT-3) TaxID=70601 RepID=O57814_PYRHO|nr:110aa long hypothetical protein [Pyrococcus horikoshii OT3]